MPEPADSSLSRRGTWIGLRTLRQRPKIVDHTPSGEPIFEVRSVRLLLQPDADHFNRLETCSKCGRNVPGGPVFDMADLDRPSNPLICTTCVQAVAKPTLLRPGGRRPPAQPPAPPKRPVEALAAGSGSKTADVPAAGSPAAGKAERALKDDVAGDDLRKRLQSVTQLLEAQQRELGALTEAVRETRGELRSATESQGNLARSQQELDERMATLALHAQQPGSGGATISEVERDLRHNLQFVTELLQAQQRELAALSAAVVEAQNDLRAATEAYQTLARAQQDLDRRLTELPPAVPPSEESARRTESLERGLEDLSARLADGLTHARAESKDLVAQIRADMGALAQSLEAQLRRFEASRDSGARDELRRLAQAVAGLRNSSSEHGSRLDALQRAVEDVTTELSSMVEAEHIGPPEWRDQAAAPPGEVVRGGLLDALERQLHDAERRLTRLSGRSHDSN